MKYGNYQENFDKNVLLSKSPGNTLHVVTIFNNILFTLSATFSSSLHLSHHSAVSEAKNFHLTLFMIKLSSMVLFHIQ